MWASLPPSIGMTPERQQAAEATATYAGCDEVRALGKGPLYAGQPGHRPEMDGDGNGIACEPSRG